MIIDENVENFLEHHGILGMRWGQRRQRLSEHLDRVNRIQTGTATEADYRAVSLRRKRALKKVAIIGGGIAVIHGRKWVKKYLASRAAEKLVRSLP